MQILFLLSLMAIEGHFKCILGQIKLITYKYIRLRTNITNKYIWITYIYYIKIQMAYYTHILHIYTFSFLHIHILHINIYAHININSDTICLC